MKYLLTVLVIAITLLIYAGKRFVCFTVEPGNNDFKLNLITLPAGFKIYLYASGIPGARSMTAGPDGTIFVGTRNEGKIYAVKDTDGDYKADRVYTVDDGLNMPNGVAFYNGSLFAAEVHRVLRYDNIMKRLTEQPEPVVVKDTFPHDRHHGWKYIAFGPDNKLYVPVGAPCNICESSDKKYASIMRMNPDGTDLEIFAHGVRNSVGFDWDPSTGDLWFTDNGRDWMGNNLPPDELNHASKTGMHFGYPYCHGSGIPDPEYGNKRECREFIKPAAELGAHVASLGMKFYKGKQFPPEYRNRIFIAEHGSWNRNPPDGYRITTVTISYGRAVAYSVFASGWLQGSRADGRPVDILILSDGSMLVSDDLKGAIYRIYYSE